MAGSPKPSQGGAHAGAVGAGESRGSSPPRRYPGKTCLRRGCHACLKPVPERADPRYAHEAAVTFLVADQAFQGRTTNVSRGGLCAEFADPIAVGAEIEIEMRLVFDHESQSDPLHLPARVVWCTTVDEACQVGIAFRPLPPQLAQHLTKFLSYLETDAKAPRSKRESTVDKRFD
jgi:hypothetical protein